MQINYSLSKFQKQRGFVNMIGLAYPDFSPIAFSLGPLDIRWYSLAYLVGIVAAWFLLLKNNAKYNLGYSKQNIEDLAFYATIGIIAGGRLGYAIFYGGADMWLKPWRLLELWKGGMSFHGGVLGVIVAIWIYARQFKYKFLAITDLVALYAPIGMFLGRCANFVNDELWGRATDVPWAIRFPNGGFLPRHPSQLYEAFFEGIVLFIILNWLWRYEKVRQNHGIISAVFIIAYGVFRCMAEQFREPDAQLGFLFAGITMGQLLSLPLILIGIIILVKKIKKPTPAK